jgi:hypothetical protein
LLQPQLLVLIRSSLRIRTTSALHCFFIADSAKKKNQQKKNRRRKWNRQRETE